MRVVTQAEFARLHQVSRKTVTTWKKRGYIKVSGNLVDVETSNRLLAGAGRAWPKAVTAAEPGCSSGCGPVTRTDIPMIFAPDILIASSESAALRLSELLLRHLPMDVARSLVDEFMAQERRGNAEILDDEIGPPAGYAGWADHPTFIGPVINEDEWVESAQLAAAHIQANGAAPDA